MKNIFGLILILGLFFCLTLPAVGQSQGQAKLRFGGATMPSVDFAHDIHIQKVEDCKTCHHYGVGTGTCADCHGGDSRARSKKDAFHGSCRGCHVKEGVSKKKDCGFCHKG